MKSCPRCGKQYPDTEGFCGNDGAELVKGSPLGRGRLTSQITEQIYPEQGLECPVCGGKALPGEVRCNYCGARLRANDAGPETSEPSAQTTPSPDLDPQNDWSGAQDSTDASPDVSGEEKPKRNQFVRILGFSSAAVVALAAGAWLALYLSKIQSSPRGLSTPSVASSAPVVELANDTPIRTQGDTPGTMPRDVDALRKVFEDNKAGLANVYTEALGSDPSMTNGMVVRLHVLPNGSVDNGAVRISTAGNPSFDAEVVEAMTSWKFSPASTGANVEYRLIFAPTATAVSSVESNLAAKLASLSPDEPAEYAFSPSGVGSSAAEMSPSATPSLAAAGASPGGSAEALTGSPAPTPEPTSLAALPTASALSSPTRLKPAPVRARHHRHAAPTLASLPPPKPPLIERVNSELRADRRFRRVQAYTNGSVVTIFGKVFDDKDRLLAERAVKKIDGVSAVIDNLTTDTQQWAQNQALITQALQSAGFNDVRVKVIGNDAYLSGQVKTELDRERAVTVAQSAAPVKVRENLITVKIGNVLGF
jgi:TonB family protein